MAVAAHWQVVTQSSKVDSAPIIGANSKGVRRAWRSFQALIIGRTPRGFLSVDLGLPVRFHLAPIEAHARMVAERARVSMRRLAIWVGLRRPKLGNRPGKARKVENYAMPRRNREPSWGRRERAGSVSASRVIPYQRYDSDKGTQPPGDDMPRYGHRRPAGCGRPWGRDLRLSHVAASRPSQCQNRPGRRCCREWMACRCRRLDC
jgi:hypothetical protein